MDQFNQEPEMRPGGLIKNLPKKERYAFYLFSVAAVFFLVFSLYNFSARINKPLAPKSNQPDNLLNNSEEQLKKLQELQSKDTDQDGLSDYDELYVYKTSPYLEDTDSDGITDRDEILQGKDPTCPEGQQCSPYSDVGEIAASGALPENFLTEEQKKTAAQLRQTMIQSGQFTAEQLAGISDSDLISIAASALQQSQGQFTNTPDLLNMSSGLSLGDLTNLSLNANSSLINIDNLPLGGGSSSVASQTDLGLGGGNLNINASTNGSAATSATLPTAAEIRQYLISQGGDQATLDKISDEDLLKMFSQVVAEEKNTNQ